MPKTVIFDFDGTIADTLDSIIEIINELSDEYGFRKVKPDEVEKLRGKRPREILKYLRISFFKLPFVVRRARKRINSKIAGLEPTVDLAPTLRVIKEKGYSVGIVTTNIEDNVRKFLHSNDMDVFDFFYTTRQVFGKHKTLSRILKDHKLTNSDVFFVGDEIRDVEAARKVGIKMIAVTWGFNTRDALKGSAPDFLVDSPDEIQKIILTE